MEGSEESWGSQTEAEDGDRVDPVLVVNQRFGLTLEREPVKKPEPDP